MLRVNLHVLWLLQNLMTALQIAYHDQNIKNRTHKYFPLFVICQQEFFFCVNHLNIFHNWFLHHLKRPWTSLKLILHDKN